MKSLYVLWVAALLLPAGWGLGYETDGGSGGRVQSGGGGYGGPRIVTVHSGGCSGSRTVSTATTIRPGVRPAGPIGSMGGVYVSGRSGGPVGAMGSTRGTSNAGPVGAMGSNQRPTRVVGERPTAQTVPNSQATVIENNPPDYARLTQVAWGYSVRAMKAALETTEEPFAIFFCSPATARYTGGGKEAFESYRQSFPGRPTPTTVFDERTSVEALQAAGVRKFVRVPTKPENLDLMRAYGAPANSETLVICGFNGDPLVTLRGENCVQSQVTGTMKDFAARYEKWKLALQEKLDRESQAQRPRGTIEIMKWE